jgi:hypothetical protein
MAIDPLRSLKAIGRDVTLITVARLPASFERVAFICVNTYTSSQLNLGKGPLNDAVSFANVAKKAGFEIFFLHNPRCKTFLSYLDAFFARTSNRLIFYYVGHGTNVRDMDGDESDRQDEAFVFDDGTVIDDVLLQHLCEKKHPDSALVLVTDACHSGSIWDIPTITIRGRNLPPNVLSLAAANDAQTAKQTMIDRKDQGVFTYNLAKILNADLHASPRDIAAKMKPALKSYAQSFTVGATTPSLVDVPLF